MEKNVQTRALERVGSQRHLPRMEVHWARLGASVHEPKSPVPGKGLETRLGLEEPELDRQGVVERTGEKGGPGFIGVLSLRAKEQKAKFSAAEGLAGRGGNKVFITGTTGDSCFRSAARMGWGSPASGQA